ncbi:hypothetical protein [Virgibacillus pantothenticus]|uniref:hypothetical protein n=1 Tax=Virgibacillus pantothenticus TaxID=1473 RepID=UPI00399D7494
MTVSEWLDTWYDVHKNEWKDSTREHRKLVIDKHFKPLLGKYKLAQLNKTIYKRVFINKLLKQMNPNTV